MGQLLFDLRDALRGVRRDRSYAATVVLTLALTIGATTAVFSIVDGVLLRPLAYRESHQLVSIREVLRQLAGLYPTLPVNALHFREWRAQATSFASLAEYRSASANFTGRGEPAELVIVRATGTLFDVLQVSAAVGRTLSLADEDQNAPPVAVISDALWRQRYASDPSAVGQAITLDGKPYTIAGVLPAGFVTPEPATFAGGVQLTSTVDVFLPLRLDLSTEGWAGDFNYSVLGRLRAGVPIEQARAEMDVLQRRISGIATERAHEPVTLSASMQPLGDAVVGAARRGLLLLLGAIAAVLLIACSNLANLSLTRTVGRVRDAAIRVALGAGRDRLIARVVLEQLVLAIAGGALGILVAWGALTLFVRTAPIELPRAGDVALDARVLAFAAAVSIAAGLLVALLPAWRLAGRDVQGALRAASLSLTSDRSGLRARGGLLALQVALSVTLLVVTALLGVSFTRLAGVDRGFATDRVLTASVALPAGKYAEPAARGAALERVLAAVHALPGVDTATWTSILPLRGETWVDQIAAEGDVRPPHDRPIANYRFIAPEFFKTLRIPIVRGRTFAENERDPQRPMPALVSERTAARAWPGRDALGQRFRRGEVGEQPFEVVGIVPDARTTALDQTPPLMVYLPYWWRPSARASLMLHTRTDAAALASDLRRAIWSVDPEAAIGDVRPLDAVVDASLASRRYQMTLFVAFGVAALLIAIVGVYAVTAYGVSRRRREMNIRAALGAQRSQILGMVVRQGSGPILAGLAAGGAGALVTGRLVSTMLFEVAPRDPLVIGGVVALVAAVGVLACAIAARQGLSLNPAAALRDE